MNKLLATLIAAAFVFVAASAIAQDSTKAPTLTKEEQDKAKARRRPKKSKAQRRPRKRRERGKVRKKSSSRVAIRSPP